MYCENCGYPLNKGDRECSFCGKELSQEQLNSAHYNPEDFSQEAEAESSGQDDSRESSGHFIGHNDPFDFLEQEEDDLFSNTYDKLEGTPNHAVTEEIEDLERQDLLLEDSAQDEENTSEYRDDFSSWNQSFQENDDGVGFDFGIVDGGDSDEQFAAGRVESTEGNQFNNSNMDSRYDPYEDESEEIEGFQKKDALNTNFQYGNGQYDKLLDETDGYDSFEDLDKGYENFSGNSSQFGNFQEENEAFENLDGEEEQFGSFENEDFSYGKMLGQDGGYGNFHENGSEEENFGFGVDENNSNQGSTISYEGFFEEEDEFNTPGSLDSRYGNFKRSNDDDPSLNVSDYQYEGFPDNSGYEGSRDGVDNQYGNFQSYVDRYGNFGDDYDEFDNLDGVDNQTPESFNAPGFIDPHDRLSSQPIAEGEEEDFSDRDIFEETEEGYQEDDPQSRNYGKLKALNHYLDDEGLPEPEPPLKKELEEIVDDEIVLDVEKSDPSLFFSKIVNQETILQPSSNEQLRGAKLNEFVKSYDEKKRMRGFIIIAIVVGIIFLGILINFLRNFSDSSKKTLIEAERGNLTKLLDDLAKNNKNMLDNEVLPLVEGNSSSRYEISNFAIDQNSFAKFGLPNPNSYYRFHPQMRILWDRKNAPKDKLWYNDLLLNFNQTELLRVQSLKKGNILKLMVPSVYGKIFQVDTSDLTSFYNSIGLKKETGYLPKFISEVDFAKNLRFNPNINDLVTLYLNLLIAAPEDKEHLNVMKDVKLTVNGAPVITTQTKLKFDEAQCLQALKLILDRIKKDPEVFKALTGKYSGLVEVVKLLGLDDGRLEDLTKENVGAYFDGLLKDVAKIKIPKGAVLTIWIDNSNRTVARKVEFEYTEEKGTVAVNFDTMNLEETSGKYSLAKYSCVSKSANVRNMELKREENVKFELFGKEVLPKSIVKSTKINVGNPGNVGYRKFELLSEYNYPTQSEKKGKMELDAENASSKGTFKFKVSATGTESGSAKTGKYNGDYAVSYDIASKNKYVGSFSFKYDTTTGGSIQLPNNTPVQENNPVIDMNKLSGTKPMELYLDIQINYNLWQQKLMNILK